MNPVFGHGQLRLYLLALLQDGPRHGYDIIKALADQFGGTYTPSPGTDYPRLAKLVDEGLVTKIADGRRTLYELTDAGRAEVEGRTIELATVVTDIASSVEQRANQLRDDVASTMGSLRDSLQFEASASRSHSYDVPTPPPYPDPAAARMLLKQAEVDLSMFRATTRADLRVAAAKGLLTEQIVSQLHNALDDVSATLRSALK